MITPLAFPPELDRVDRRSRNIFSDRQLSLPQGTPVSRHRAGPQSNGSVDPRRGSLPQAADVTVTAVSCAYRARSRCDRSQLRTVASVTGGSRSAKCLGKHRGRFELKGGEGVTGRTRHSLELCLNCKSIFWAEKDNLTEMSLSD